MLKVLIVEDSHATRVCYRFWCDGLFQKLGEPGTIHEVDGWETAMDRLGASGKGPYHLALIDICFPVEREDAHGRTVVDMDTSAGLKLCEMMGRDHADTPIIVASSTRADKGAVDFLTDPQKCPTVVAFVPEPFTQARFLELAMPVLSQHVAKDEYQTGSL